MFCNNCGTRIQTNAQFCQNCGTASTSNGQEQISNSNNLVSAPKKNSLANTIFKVFLGLIGILVVLMIIGALIDSSSIECDGSEVKDLLKEAIDESQFARLSGLSAIKITNIQDTGSVEENLSCTADVTFNTTDEVKVSYKVTPNDDNIGEYWLEFKVIQEY